MTFELNPEWEERKWRSRPQGVSFAKKDCAKGLGAVTTQVCFKNKRCSSFIYTPSLAIRSVLLNCSRHCLLPSPTETSYNFISRNFRNTTNGFECLLVITHIVKDSQNLVRIVQRMPIYPDSSLLIFYHLLHFSASWFGGKLQA